MKYIKTKDGIYDTYSTHIQLGKAKITNEIKYYYQSNAYSIPFKLEVLSQADTVEKLCDEFDIIIPAGIYRYGIYHMRFEGYGDFIRTWKEYKEKHGNNFNHFEMIGAYGAIWTGKGLIYVAKMNDKGELCLI